MIPLVRAMAPAVLDEQGIGALLAAQVMVSWSRPGRCRDEAAFAGLGGVAPLEAISGQTQATSSALARRRTSVQPSAAPSFSWGQAGIRRQGARDYCTDL